MTLKTRQARFFSVIYAVADPAFERAGRVTVDRRNEKREPYAKAFGKNELLIQLDPKPYLIR